MNAHILVAVDGTEVANRAVDTAARIATSLGVALCIAHVQRAGRSGADWRRMAEVEHLVTPAGTPAPTPMPLHLAAMMLGAIGAPAEQGGAQTLTALSEDLLLRARERALKAGAMNVTTRLCSGSASEKLLALAKAEPPEMIVVGSIVTGPLRGDFAGSVSQKLLQRAPCTVVVVR